MSAADNHILRFAKQTTGIEQIVSSGLTSICTVGNPTPRITQTKIDRNVRCGDLEKTSRVLGPKDPGAEFTTEFFGPSTVGSNGQAAVPAETHDILLEVLMGAQGVAGTGDTISSATGTTLTVSGSNLQNGDFVLLTGNTSGRKQVRQVISGGGTVNPVIDRALTEDDGTAEDPATGEVWAGVRYDLDNSNLDQETLYVDIEGDTMRHQIIGAVVTALGLNMPPNGERVLCNWSLDANDWERAALASPALAAPTDGTVVTVANAPFWIGTAQYTARDLNLTVTRTANRKTTQFGENGFYGHAAVGSDVQLTGSIYLGTSDLEAGATVRDSLNAAGTHDVLIQIGRTAGRILAVRIPACDFTVEQDEADGLDILSFTGMATRETGVTGATSPLSIVSL